VRLLVLAGTEDGRELADALKQRGHEVLVSTLTAYGADLAQGQGLQARSGAMDEEGLTDLLRGSSFAALVDATHPYAVRVKEMAKKVCANLSLPYLRWERSALELEDHSYIHWAEDIPDAARIAAGLGHRIMLTTGSNGLPEWVSLPLLKDKLLYVRVLPTSEVLARCESLGFKPNQIIAAQGPFSQAWDEAMFRQLDVKLMLIGKNEFLSLRIMFDGINDPFRCQTCGFNTNAPCTRPNIHDTVLFRNLGFGEYLHTNFRLGHGNLAPQKLFIWYSQPGPGSFFGRILKGLGMLISSLIERRIAILPAGRMKNNNCIL